MPVRDGVGAIIYGPSKMIPNYLSMRNNVTSSMDVLGSMKLKEGKKFDYEKRQNRVVKRFNLPSYQGESSLQRIHGFDHQRLLEFKS